jgi:hypothetical protein
MTMPDTHDDAHPESIDGAPVLSNWTDPHGRRYADVRSEDGTRATYCYLPAPRKWVTLAEYQAMTV